MESKDYVDRGDCKSMPFFEAGMMFIDVGRLTVGGAGGFPKGSIIQMSPDIGMGKTV